MLKDVFSMDELVLQVAKWLLLSEVIDSVNSQKTELT